MKREDIFKFVAPDSICIELGVAQGEFADKVLSKYDVVLYGVDKWNDHHNEKEYQTTLKRLEKFGDRSIIIRKSFDEALSLFEDEFFDLIYIDGYAHTGQEAGKTLYDWYSKLKVGGVFAGDDYTKKFPGNIKAVNEFIESQSLELNLTTEVDSQSIWSKYPSWYTFKE